MFSAAAHDCRSLYILITELSVSKDPRIWSPGFGSRKQNDISALLSKGFFKIFFKDDIGATDILVRRSF